AGQHAVPFDEPRDLVFHERESLPRHPNGMRLTALAASGGPLACEVYYSVGGGFVIREGEEAPGGGAVRVPYEVRTAAELLAGGRRTGLSIAEVVRANERAFRPEAETDAALDRVWAVMEQCIERGCRGEGVLPGGLNVRRRAGRLFRDLQAGSKTPDPLAALD